MLSVETYDDIQEDLTKLTTEELMKHKRLQFNADERRAYRTAIAACKSVLSNYRPKEDDRIQFAIKQFKTHNLEFSLKNDETGHFHCRRKSDDKLFQFYAYTGKIMNYEKRGIHNLIKLLEEGCD